MLFLFVLATTAITLAISSPFDDDESATCTYTCNSDGSCEHRTDLTSGYHYSMKSGTCVSPKYSCLNGICCKGQTYQCGECRDKCHDKVGKLVIEDGQVKSNGLRTNENKPATHSNNLQTTRHNSPSPLSNPRGGNLSLIFFYMSLISLNLNSMRFVKNCYLFAILQSKKIKTF